MFCQGISPKAQLTLSCTTCVLQKYGISLLDTFPPCSGVNWVSRSNRIDQEKFYLSSPRNSSICLFSIVRCIQITINCHSSQWMLNYSLVYQNYIFVIQKLSKSMTSLGFLLRSFADACTETNLFVFFFAVGTEQSSNR